MKIRIIFLLLFFTTSAAAQPRQEFFKLYDPYYNPQAVNFDLDYLYAPQLESDTNSVTEFDQHDFNAELLIPVKASERLHANFGLKYGLRYYDYNDLPIGSVLDEDAEELHTIALTPGALYFFNRDTAFQGEVTVGSFSNLDGGIKGDDIQYLGKALFIHHWRTNVQLLGGFGVTETFDDNEFIPILGIRAVYKNWHLSVTAPLDAQATYRVNDRVSLYGGAWLSGAEYQIRGSNTDDFDIQVRDTRLGLGLDMWLLRDFRFSIEGGALLGNDGLEIKGAGDNGETDGDLDSAGYVRIRIGSYFG